MSNLYQRMTETLAENMGDTLVVNNQFKEAIVRIADLEKEVEASWQNADHWMARKEELERSNVGLCEALADKWEALSEIREVWKGSDGYIAETCPNEYLKSLLIQGYDIAVEALKK